VGTRHIASPRQSFPGLVGVEPSPAPVQSHHCGIGGIETAGCGYVSLHTNHKEVG